ncbi:type VII secretion protein EccE [Actinomycetospora endophytica]|uniref:Type VII secretion protein EccE n=1 Tax=Actinomycetospora endophytica TaxID=2291215 RepID=A0ABS8P3H6_9PSEU|nr:type VII secretion protein EccE [Actinomycetospora endophytica]MCD2192517.1 type VII secretion protein EccE [Actinomycetospora endophytica]
MSAPERAVVRASPGDGDGRLPAAGPVRIGGLLVVEVGLAVALGLLALGAGLPVAGIVLSVALVAGLVRVRGELVGAWAVLALRHRLRTRETSTDPAAADADGLDLGPLDPAVGEVTVVDDRDHDGRPVAVAGADDGTWSAVLVVDPDEQPLLIDAPWSGGFPLAALAGTLTDRGVVLDALTVVRHVRPGGADSPARQAHRQVLGPLADAAHRSAWLVVRLDPDRCPGAVAERGGGVLGARRALVGALARIGRVLAEADLPVRPLDRDGLRDAVATAAAADLDRAPGGVTERWDAVVVGEVGHATWAATDLAVAPGARLDLDDLVAPDAVTTLALALLPDQALPDGDAAVGVAARVRVSARTPEALIDAGAAVVGAARARGMVLEPLHGRQVAGLRSTLPLGGLT